MQVCTLLQTDNHASTPPLSVLQAGCSSCHPTNSVKVLKAYTNSVKIPKRTQSTDDNEEISPTAVSPILEPVPDPRMDTMPVISALQWQYSTAIFQLSSVLFFSRPRSEGWPHHGRTFSIYLCPLSFWPTLPQGSPVHVLMLSIQAVRGLPRLHAPGIVPCIISFSTQLLCYLMVF